MLQERRHAIFDNGMLGAVGCAMQADRLAQANRSLRLRDAEASMVWARSADRVRAAGRTLRRSAAKRLIALAMRMAPNGTAVGAPVPTPVR